MRVVLVSCVLLVVAACELPQDSSSDGGAADGGTECGDATCGIAEVCLYRTCTFEQRCQPATSCPSGWTPADCNGTPGCLAPSCPLQVQGCRKVPDSCGNDAKCACDSICETAAGGTCSQTSGRTILCDAPLK